MSLILRLVALLVLLLSATTAQAQIQRSERIAAELVPMSQWAAPGGTVIVAVRQDIAPGWHTYWRNPGDSGGATRLDWTLPAGVTAGDILWPLPGRQPIATLVNYGYEGEVYLPVPVEIPADARPGQTLLLRVEAHFLVCSDEMCIPDDLTLTLALPVRDGAAPLDPRHGAAIEQVVREAPRPADIQARAVIENGAIRLTAAGGPLADAAPTRAWFLPFTPGVIDHAAAQTGERGPDGVTLTLKPGGAALAAPLDGVLVVDGVGYEIKTASGAPLTGVTGDGATIDEEGPAQGASGGWLAVLQAAGLAFLGGLVLNLMPCVFPILAMKAAALASVGGDPRAARRDGLGFLAGVLLAFLALAGALLILRAGGQAVGWGFQLQSPAVTAGLALLMLAVALNLAGVFHMGSGLQGAANAPLSRLPGWAGAMGTGVLAVAVAAPCTAPFMAVALGAALIMPWPQALAVFAMLGLGFAAPFVVASLTPGLIRRLPRPGPWMERLRTILAFPMFGAALWLAWVFAQQAGPTASGLLLAGGLTLAFALWAWDLRRQSHEAGRKGWAALAAAGIGAVVALTCVVTAVSTAAPPSTSGPASGSLAAQAWSPEAVRAAQAEGRPVFVNFTADWCVTCKVNERAALSSAGLSDAFTTARAAYLVGDWTLRDDAIAAELQRHGRSGVPLYLMYPAGGGEPVVLPQLLTEGAVAAALKAASTP